MLVAHRVRCDVGCGRSRGGRNDRRAGDRSRRLGAADGAARLADIDLVERFRALPELRRHFHYHMVLVELVVDGRNLALAEGIVERVVDLRCGEAEAGCRGAVDLEFDFQPLIAAVRVDVLQFAHVLQCVGDLGHPLLEIFERVRGDGVLVGAVALPPADANVLSALQEEPRTGNIAELGANSLDDIVGAETATLGQRLQLYEDVSGVGGAAARTAAAATRRAGNGVDCGILADDLHERAELLFHQLKRDRGTCADAAEYLARVLGLGTMT